MIRGISQVELARKTKYRQPQISDWFTGRKFPKPETIHELAEAMGMQSEDLARMLMIRRQNRITVDQVDSE
jgi:transcriptional regulator with XRE-family HTH domain